VAEDDRDQQIQIVESFIVDQVDAIVLAPLDRVALRNVVRRAKDQGIPIVIIDSGIDYDKIDSYVATNNYNGGVMAARHMGKLLDGKGNLIVLRYQTGSASTEEREKGFLDTIKSEFPEMTILSDNQESGAKREGALAKAEDLLIKFGDKVDGWFCPCEPVVVGTVKAIANKGLTGKIKVVGFDATPEVVRALRAKEAHGVVLQDPVNMGYLGVKTAVQILEGKPVERVISTGEYLVTPENMDEPRSKELHSPDLTPWLGG
jgi:ribose transport system substrate-binding protein